MVDGAADDQHRDGLVQKVDAVLQKVRLGLVHVTHVLARRRRENFAREPRARGIFDRSRWLDVRLREGIEKWILRQGMAGALPDAVLNRRKAKFWVGAGVEDALAQYADEKNRCR